jgi:hypothetical protein
VFEIQNKQRNLWTLEKKSIFFLNDIDKVNKNQIFAGKMDEPDPDPTGPSPEEVQEVVDFFSQGKTNLNVQFSAIRGHLRSSLSL